MRAFSVFFGVLMLTAVAGGQTAPASTTPPSQAPAPPPAAPPSDYTYQPDGRRDPFLNLLGSGAEPRIVARRGDGPASLAVSDLSVRGVLQAKGALIALVQGPDNRTYIIRPGEKLMDGTVKSVTPQGLVIVQEVNDPLSLVKQREIRKLLRSLEDAK